MWDTELWALLPIAPIGVGLLPFFGGDAHKLPVKRLRPSVVTVPGRTLANK